ncbi:MAG: hypothetical protein ACLP4W_21550 [Mycobacterium sp.]|uniref:hypothetical protein n=1 Tax=Mycobacterium sp. TaxID=1785 RepID=UPI00284A99B6|nr:hypothetical protein [Mycobacterium sp.]
MTFDGCRASGTDPQIVRLQRIAMNESARFPEFAISGETMPSPLNSLTSSRFWSGIWPPKVSVTRTGSPRR